jgi:hypothetical protein
MSLTRRYVLASGAALTGAIVVYLSGIWGGRFLDLRPTSDYCSRAELGEPPITWSWFPLSNECHYVGAGSQELVPAYVNPLLYLCLAAAVLFVVLAVRASTHTRKATHHDH